MNAIAQFKKVSFDQFYKDCLICFKAIDVEACKLMYEQIKLPKRATIGSAGYDFFIPKAVTLQASEALKIPTGICCKMDSTWVLQLYPRSSLGFKYRLQLDNTVGIIDSDYFHALNEGHIIVKMTNHAKDQLLILKQGDGFMQGIFIQYGITVDDEVSQKRKGGFGSTNE